MRPIGIRAQPHDGGGRNWAAVVRVADCAVPLLRRHVEDRCLVTREEELVLRRQLTHWIQFQRQGAQTNGSVTVITYVHH